MHSKAKLNTRKIPKGYFSSCPQAGHFPVTMMLVSELFRKHRLVIPMKLRLKNNMLRHKKRLM